MRRVHSIVIHHTAGSQHATAEQINRRHISNGWLGIGYHFVIRRDDSTRGWCIDIGRDINKKGAHAGRGFPGNLGSIGIAVAGNYVKEPPPKEALVLLTGLVRKLRSDYGDLRIWGHCDLNATACPGQKLYDWLPVIDAFAETIGCQLISKYYDDGEAPLPRKFAESRKVAREFFRLRSLWAKVGG